MRNIRLHIIRLFVLLLMLISGGMGNEAWAQKKVKYHILTKPFDVPNYDNTNTEWKNNIRVEALLCESDETTIGLPDQFKSPLAKNFRYWATATSAYGSLYDYGHGTKIINTKYNIYQCGTDESVENWQYACLSNELTEGSSVDSYTDLTDIYVTYDYINDGESVGYKNGIMELDGATDYNIAFTNVTEKFMCYNRSRNNRVANANGAGLSGEDLASDEFVKPAEGTADNQLGWNYSKWGPHGLFAGFMFTGQDPYNITILTSYKGDQLHITDGITGVDDKKATIKPYASSSIMAKIGANSLWFDASNNKHYKIFSGCTSEKDWTDARYAELHDLYWNTSEEKRYDDWVGFYRNESPTLSTFALLPNKTKGGYMFVGSKLNQNNKQEQPSNGNYYIYYDNYDKETGVPKRSQPYFKLLSLGSAYSTNFYEIKTYTVHVTTHGSEREITATMKWSDARLSDNPADHVPEALRRKYVTYTAYSDAAHNNPVATFQAIQAANNGMHIYLDYTVSESMPFETLPAGGNYTNARWYTMRMDGVTNPKYIAYEGTSNSLVVTNETGDAKGSNTASQVHQGENSAEAMVAFMGDPYELKILNRKACETVGYNTFIGCPAASALGTGLTTNNGTSDITTWEIVYESTGVDGFLLRKFKTANEAEGEETKPTPKYIGLGEATNYKPVTYSATGSRIKVEELDKKKYAFHIMRIDGTMAVMATTSEDVGKALKGDYTDIPEIIRSPFLSTATVNFYDTQTKATANNPENKITNLPYNPDNVTPGVYANIYVRYSFAVSLSEGTFNVRLNNEYIYTVSDDVKSKATITPEEAGCNPYQWVLDYTDPYAMTIKNHETDQYVKFDSWSNDTPITWTSDLSDASLFVAKSGALDRTYEVMAATGDGVDASATYYDIGRPATNTVRLYSNSSYLHGNATLRFQLISTKASDVTYHLIDKTGKVLLEAVTRHTSEDDPAFPPEYHSPLVEKYHYYLEGNFTTEGEGANKTYTLKPAQSEITTISTNVNIYVTYDVNDLVNLKAGQLYLLKYEAGENFRQEDGFDALLPAVGDMSANTYRYKAVYPYVNGDGNFFVYGQEQYDIQQQGASSTRTRWAWYVESNVDGAPKGDPYHVTIKSRQTESYPITNSSEYNAYFMTYKPDGYSEVITTLGWPGMNSETATEYMVLGSEGQYQLVTTNEISGSRYVVNSFEQYWKTYDTIRRKLLKQSDKTDYPDNDSDPETVPETPCLVDGFSNNRTYLTTSTEAATPGMGFHSYEKWAYAKRWNGYNNGYSHKEGTHETKKGWEKIEHWYQTVNMGEGYFDFVKTSIDPVLILLDQHGWEIMRKPLPSDPDDPKKEEKYAAIRPYNSPMVKEYAFWSTAKKRTGFHQYYLLSDRIGGDDFTSTDLTNLPPYGSKNVLDKKGNLNDQYVTYIVKDEYAQTYTPKTKTGKEFLIEQGSKYAAVDDTPDLSPKVIPSGGLKQYITEGHATDDKEKWYVKPNADIDIEMGYNDAVHTWTTKKEDGSWDNKNPNAYDHYKYKDALTAQYISDKDSLGYFSFSNGFDPYNIQIESVSPSAKYMKTNANGAELVEGALVGSYATNPGTVTMGDNTTTISPKPKWYDSRNLDVTNATYMAVQDEDGNMQLMPRFDHSTRMSEFGTLIAPTDAEVTKTYTKLYRPEVYEYLIIDNDGHESLRYKSGGDMTPQTPNHFQSPLAANFTYYAKATYDSGTGTYSGITDEIEKSLDGATLTNNKVYVRYEYNSESDVLNMLKGNWLTMQLNKKDAIYNEGIKQGTSKPATIDATEKEWQWKFAHNSQPDPYAIYLYNRNQIAGTKAITDHRFALLSHSAGDYALAKAGREDYTYQFLNGSSMDASRAAIIDTEADFTPTSGTFVGTNSQVKLTDEVVHAFTYKVYTNGGVNAIDAIQLQEDVHNSDWKPVLPESARTPLLNLNQYRYYERSLAGTVAENDTLKKSLSYLYGLYDDIVYTHYTAYDANASTYVVPNVRNTPGGTVAKGVGSNDAQIGLDGKRPYNIIWYDDKMMKSNGTSISYEDDLELQASAAYEWEFAGDDPYAIKIKSVGVAGNYIHESTTTPMTTELSTTATPFMLLNKDGYDYGVFTKTGTAVTGDTPVMLSGCGNTLTTDDPYKFIPFALSTYKVIYHLMIKNIGSEGVIIPYRKPNEGADKIKYTWIKSGTTLRDLTSDNGVEGATPGDRYQLGASLKAIDGIDHTTDDALGKRDSIYCVDAGHVSLGDAFEVPQVFYRPNVDYDFYIEGVYSADGKSEIPAMNKEYKGLKMNHMGEDSHLLGTIVFVNIVYNFMGGLDTNSGSDFVESVSQNKWYTFETSGATPMLAEYTGTLQTVSGYATHYTNDYLWTPVGDPYGFKMYNRYLYKNLGENKVMSTERFATDEAIVIVNDNAETPHLPANSVYELLAVNTTTSGYFRIHPVVNMRDATQFYLRNVVSDGRGVIKLNTAPTDWTFGLSEEVMRPYYQAAGYVGGLNAAGKAAYETAAAKTNPLEKLMTLQDVVYNHDNNNSEDDPTNPNYIVHYTPGYYRLHNQPGSSGITTPRYMSGYTHLIESTDYDNNSSADADGDENSAVDILPLHFYEVEKYDVNNPTFNDLSTAGTDYTESVATRGDIPLVTVDKDPASIFYFAGAAAASPSSTMQTQGLYVKGNKMTATPGDATSFNIIDIGAGIVALQGGDYFLKYAQTNPKYDLKFDNTLSTVESTRWCMQPVQKGATVGNGEMPLKVATNNGGDEHYYTTFYAPFDVLLTGANDVAYIIPSGQWPAMTTASTQYILYPKEIGEYNTAERGCPEGYRGNNRFIPAGTPVIIRTKNTSGEVTMALPTTSPSESITTALDGQYLEQMLAQGSDYVFVLGRSYTHSDEFTYNGGTGVVTPAGLEFDRGVGFYKNANNNRESNATKTMWTRNNKYVYGNKVYYRAGIADVGGSREMRGIEFVPTIFDLEDEEQPGEEEQNPSEGVSFQGDGCIYDMMGRKVATRQQVEDGSWRLLRPGIYILNGKKFRH